MNKKLKSFLRGFFSVALMTLFIWLAFRGKNLSELWNSLTNVPWYWFVGLFIGGIVSHIFRAWRWKYLLYPIKKDVSLRNAFSALMIGYMVNGIFPRLGELVRPYAIKKMEGISGTSALGTVILERIIDIISFAVIVSVVMFFYAEKFTLWFPSLAQYDWIISAGAVIMFVSFVLIFLKAEWIFSFIKHFSKILPKHIQTKIDSLFDSFLSGFQAANVPGNYFMIAATSLLTWLSYIILLYLPFFAFTLNELTFGSATVLQVASGLAFAIPTPNGIGTYHTFTTFVLSQLYGIDATVALSYAIYTHAIGFISVFVAGLYYMMKDKIHLSEVTEK